MRIGILTLHSQTNYGGVLQAYALQEVLTGLGHDVVVIDRWIDERNAALRGITASRSVVGWAKFLARAVIGFGDFADYVRHLRTASMLPNLLRLTKYSFHHWSDAPKDLAVDAIVVGSDQVWNPEIQGDELPYLLEGAPHVPAIAYAASFGTNQLPFSLEARYRDGLKNFTSISVREAEAVAIAKSLGASATHVLDPTLIAEPSIWTRFTALNSAAKVRRKLVCYLINDPLGLAIDEIKDFTKARNCDTEVFFGGPCTHIPANIVELVRISTGAFRAHITPGIHTRSTATPNEFVREIAAADWVLTDSFHALMFSAIFRKNVRVLKPQTSSSTSGFARLGEFAREYTNSSIVCNGYAEALASLGSDEPVIFNESKLKKRTEYSLNWLRNALAMIHIEEDQNL